MSLAALARARRAAVAAVAALVIALLPLPGPASAIAPEPKVAVVHSDITSRTFNPDGDPFYPGRVDQTVTILQSEFSNVTKIYDADVADINVLKTYDVVVFPQMLSTTQAQRISIRQYVAGGGAIVASFGLSRWDYQAGRNPEYQSLAAMWQFSDSWDMSRVWEWGEVSELYQVKFNNDPLMHADYHVQGYDPASHPILQMTRDDVGGGALDIWASQAAYNELVWLLPGNTTTTPLVKYATRGNGSSADDGADQSLAGWAAEYYYGRVVYFGFQLHDLARSTFYTDASGQQRAQRLLINAVRWAGTENTYGFVRKLPQISMVGWFTREKLYIDGTVTNTGTIQLRGPYEAKVYNPSGALVFTGTAKNQHVPLPPGESYTLKSWQVPVGVPHQAGTWRVSMKFTYYDYFRGGWTYVARDLLMQSSGRAMTSLGMNSQTGPPGFLTPAGTRIQGASRYETAVAVSQQAFPAGLSRDAIVLATGGNFPDALAVAPLAGALNAPVLLVPNGNLPQSVSDEITRLYAGKATAKIYVAGGTGVVPNTTVNQAVAAAVAAGVPEPAVTVRRLADSDRYGTAAAIAREVGAPTSGTFADTAIVATGGGYADALAVSPLAARMKIPVLLVGQGSVPAATQTALADLGIQHVIIVGGPAAVSRGVEDWLENRGYRQRGAADNSSSVDTRLFGSSRYETSLEIVDFSVAMAGMTDAALTVATGVNFPDGLAVGPLAGRNGTPLLLVHGAEIGFSPSIARYLVTRRSAPPTLTFIGGNGAVADYVRGQVRIGLAP